MNYTIHQLQIFLEVVRHESITKASEELFMTQPAVSIQLKKFQDQFSVPLTEVIGRKLYVTDFGREVAIMAQRVLSEVKEIHYKTKEYEGALTGVLNISSASTGKYVIPFFLSDFLKGNAGIDLKLDVTNKSRVIESLKNNEIDFALVSVIPQDMDFEEEKLVENKLYLVGNHPKANKNMALIFREPGSATRKEMETYFKTREKKRKKLELTSNEAVKQAVIAGLGYSILPIIGIKNEIQNKNLFILKRENLPLKTEWRLIWLKGKKLTPVAKAFLHFVRENKKKILEEHFDWYLNFSESGMKN
ncbi:MAG: LysR family transcriptional regulator [Brumimicrobium sp.]|nr:LysR family transcriptional regulator [Brumimicrobium sp.]